MGKAGLVERARRGFYRLTAEGTRLLAAAPSRIDMKFLLTTYPVYATWRHTRSANQDPVGSSNPNVFSPNSFGVARLGLGSARRCRGYGRAFETHAV